MSTLEISFTAALSQAAAALPGLAAPLVSGTMVALPNAAETMSPISVDTQPKLTDHVRIPQTIVFNDMKSTGTVETNLVTKTTTPMQVQTAPPPPTHDPQSN
ncbi:hypothetical protein BDR26DRAFT_898837 [Obelidium mucronatum]|nr:hypothetical protein BDR26DRAFT_904273 [Obelidium mucronatum]KAI9323964.1 hypothetical protein BDR26DRAFT_943661 [Obelidium mucronatum]KAI9332699.1 hypothetical protein BDR26DRAFT_898837 [Obelidium mucronatum]